LLRLVPSQRLRALAGYVGLGYVGFKLMFGSGLELPGLIQSPLVSALPAYTGNSDT
jgi:hypothetical protein